MFGYSNVGSAAIYGAGDHMNYRDSEEQPDRFHEGKPNSHLTNDSKDNRSIVNKLSCEAKRHNETEEVDEPTAQVHKDATLPTKSHGNEPSKGARIDQELREEEAAELRQKEKGDGMLGKK